MRRGLINEDPYAAEARRRGLLNELTADEVEVRRGRGENIAEAVPYKGFWSRAKQTFSEHRNLDESMVTLVERYLLADKQIDPSTGKLLTEDDIRTRQNRRRDRERYLLAGAEPPEGVAEHVGDIAGVIAKESAAPSALMLGGVGAGATGAARAGKLAAAGGIYEGAAGTAEQLATEGEISDPAAIAERAGYGAVGAPALDVAIRGAAKGVGRVIQKGKESVAKRAQPTEEVFDEDLADVAAARAQDVPSPATDRDRYIEEAISRGLIDEGDIGHVKSAAMETPPPIRSEQAVTTPLSAEREITPAELPPQSPSRPRAALERATGIEGIAARQTMEPEVGRVPAQEPEGVPIPPETAARSTGEARAQAEGRWQRLMTAGSDGEAVAVVRGMSRDEIEQAVARLNAAPGENARAMKALEASTSTRVLTRTPSSPIDRAAHEAATSPTNAKPEPSKAQIKEGNYPKGHVRLHGLDISIENPKGSVRSGVDADGAPWQTELKSHYGYVRRTEGNDGEQLDVFIGPNASNAELPVFVVNQRKVSGKGFDEHKAILGVSSHAEAESTYLANYADDWLEKQGGKLDIAEMPLEEFKGWLRSGDTTKPVSVLPESGAASRAARWAPGARYVPFIEEARLTPKPRQPGDKPIRREDILRPFLKALGAPLYEGRVKGKKLGFYLPKKEAVRIKKKSDLEVAAHELAHLIDDRNPEIRKSWTRGPKANVYKEELRGVSYDKKLIYEGFAEYVRLWMTQTDRARLAAPEFTKWWEDFVEKADIGPAIKDAQKGMTSWFEQDALLRAQSKIGTQKPLDDTMDSVFDEFRQSVSDDLHGIYKMERELTGELSPVGPYETARLTRSAYSIVDGALTLGRPVVKENGSHAFEGKGLKQILEPISKDVNNWTLYAVGRSARELMRQGRERLFSKAEIEAMVTLETPAFRKAFEEYQAWNKAVVDFAQAKGLINPASRRLWQRTQYMPFHRAGQKAPTKRAGGVEGNWKGIRRLTGGTDNIRDVLGNMVQNAGHLITEALRNEARLEVANMANKVRGGGRFMVKIGKDTKAVAIDKSQVRRFVYELLGINPRMAEAGMVPEEMMEAVRKIQMEFELNPGYLKFWLHGQAPKGDNVIAVMRGGKPEFYEVADPILYRSIASLNRPAKHWLVQFLNGFRRIGQTSITLTPDFMAANLARDTLMGAVMSRHGFKPFLDSLKGFKSRLTKDAAYREYIANGGGFSSYLIDEGAFRKHLEGFYSKKGISYRNVINTPAKALYALEHVADAFEMATRLGEFKRARAAGDAPRHAAYLGREVSTDFAMRGDSEVLGFLFDSVMFLKAGINGIDRAYRGFAHDPNKLQIAAKTGALALTSMGLYTLNRGNPLYEQLEDWDRDVNWHIFVPKGEYYDFVELHGREPETPEEAAKLFRHTRWPKIWEIGAASSVAERTMEQFLNVAEGGDAKLQKYALDVARVTTDLFKLEYMPQAVAPLYEQAINRNRFTGRPIETPSLEDQKRWARAKPYTSDVLKRAGEATRKLPEILQIPPARAEALIRGYFNTWAMYGLTLADSMASDNNPKLRVDQYPVFRRFYSAEPARHTRHETMFYDMLREATEARRTMRAMDRQNRPDLASELEEEPETEEFKQLNRANTELRGIRAEMHKVYADATLSPRQKRKQIDELTAEKNTHLRRVVEDVELQRAVNE